MIQWLKKRIAGTLGKKKDIIKKLPIIKQLNDKANFELDNKRNELLKKYHYTILKDIYTLKSKNLNLWLDFGSLLGIYRESGYVSTDFDMDFGVLYSQLDEFYLLLAELEKKGYKKTREFIYDSRPVEYSYSYQGLNIDFVIYRKQENFIETETIAYLQNISGKITNIETYYFNIKFNGLSLFNYKDIFVEIPINTKDYLESIYGNDFMTPQLNYDWRSNKIYKKVADNFAKVILY